MNIILGISASGGIGIGRAFVIPDTEKRIIPQNKIAPELHDAQWARFNAAVAKTSEKITKKLDQVKDDKVQSQIFETYLLMLMDPEFIGEVKKAFTASDYTIEYVLDQKTLEYADKLRNSGNEYLAERAQDICDIFGQVLDELLGYHPFDIETVPDGCVIVATTLNPSDTIILSKRKIIGLALTEGGVSSHVGILARNFGIPAVFALEKITKEIKTGETVIIDGNSGEAIIDPDEQSIEDYEQKIARENEHREKLKYFRDKPAITKDGEKFQLMANIGSVEEAKIALEEGADGIGLFRTEFLFMSESDAIREEEQFRAYKQVLEIMKDKPVTIRTLDAGGDKIIHTADTPDEKNPLMGLRAIRLSLRNSVQLKIQFRALFRSAVYGNLKIMLPLITGVEQIREALKIAQKAKDELREENIPFRDDVPIGIMVETAAAAMISDCLAKESAFFSIGTNDLTQYTLGVDRENSLVSPLYDEFHLAVLRLIHKTIKAAEAAGISLSVCGEMASRTDSVIVLAGMGVRILSMSPKLITGVKEIISKMSVEELKAISSKRLNSL